MMVQDGVSNLFTKLFTIDIPDVFDVKVLDEYGESASLEAYEPRTGAIKELGINGFYDSFFLASYIETLLLLDQLDGQFVKVQLQLPPPKSKRFKRIKKQREGALTS
uniref:uncharacterized protein LOC122598576 n=1 Tax=Erigeron canadensis TaxID=72917 RepID=UPI001CB9A81F|nr:uncharacterized protein LOC122598576 [Erigeron canadensis]